MLLQPIHRDDEAEFLAAVAASRKLHEPWVAPPATPQAFTDFMNRLQGDASRGCVVRLPDNAALVGFLGITNIVRGPLAVATSVTTRSPGSSARA